MIGVGRVSTGVNARTFWRLDVGLVFAVAWVVLLVVVSVAAPLLVPYDPNAQDLLARLEPPGPAHAMGTDELGRDVYSRLLSATIISLASGVGATLIGAAIGTVCGLIAGFAGGIVDDVLMRIVDVVIAFPAIVLALAVVAVAGSSLLNVVIVLGVIQIPIFARLARSMTTVQGELEYITALRSVGVPGRRILFRHIFPNSLSTLVATAGLMIAAAILNEAALSFLGLGVAPPTATWGNMLATGRAYVLLGAWWLTVFPGVALFLSLLAFNVLADDLRDRLDPRTRGS